MLGLGGCVSRNTRLASCSMLQLRDISMECAIP